MPDAYFPFGNPIDGTLPRSLRIPAAVDMWQALKRRREFTIIEARTVPDNPQEAEALVVDCRNDQVPTQNRIGIQYRERLALVFHSNAGRAPAVLTLRAAFPATAHQNHVLPGTPRSLCLYFAPWEQVRRTWTPQFHLNRILWWLAETAAGTLHRTDQPLEQLYFDSPFELVLPPDFHEKVIDPTSRLIIQSHKRRGNALTLIGEMLPTPTQQIGKLSFASLALSLSPILHGIVETFPGTLGALHDQFKLRGAPLELPLGERIHGLCQAGRLERPDAPFTLLVLSVPLVREADAAPERIVEFGFIVERNLADLGVAMGALEKVDGAGLSDTPAGSGETYLAVRIIGRGAAPSLNWRDAPVHPLTLLRAFTPEEGRRMSDIAESGPAGTLAGFGALGSQMFNLWVRQGWGQWTVIDPDHIRPHNLARHAALARHIGMNKTEVASDLTGLVFVSQPVKTRGIPGRADDPDAKAITEAINASDVIVDVSTDLGVPRTIAARPAIRRALSAFITPSGLGAVMLIEDAERAIRLDALEGQYYRHIIVEEWGATHLAGNRGHLWTGAGCRDLSAIIPNELVAQHAANLARMTRIRLAKPEGGILIWLCDANTGAVVNHVYDPSIPEASALGRLRVLWDSTVRSKVRAERERHLPNETGGVLLGYFDLVMGTVTIVDALSAPADSKQERMGFIRGVEGLEEAVAEAGRRTANIVRYVGEWHSHPRHHSARPSGDDILLLAHLASALQNDGLPAVMLIVGETEERWLSGNAS